MSSFYNVGLQNVGSYQVSGIPFVCHHGSSIAGEAVYFEFPNVSKSIYLHFDDNSQGHQVDYVFCEPRTGMNMPDDQEYFETSGLSLTEFTVSFWLKGEQGVSRVIEFDDQTAVIIRPDGSGGAYGRLIVENAGTADSVIFSPSEWNFITIVVTSTESKIYINGANPANVTHTKSITATELYIGSDRAPINSNELYDDMSLFNVALSDEEAMELYRTTSLATLLQHSQADNLVSFWDFENNTYKAFYSNPDDGRNVYDRVSNNHLAWNNGGSANPLDATYVTGRIIDNALERHSITETGHQELTLNCKARGILARFQHSNDKLSIFASLTNIPASRMYELTGPGIDE